MVYGPSIHIYTCIHGHIHAYIHAPVPKEPKTTWSIDTEHLPFAMKYKDVSRAPCAIITLPAENRLGCMQDRMFWSSSADKT